MVIQVPIKDVGVRPSKLCENDTTEMPPVADWSEAVRGALFRPVNKPLSLRLDADVIAWFQQQGQGYQTRINLALREYIATHSKGTGVSR